MATREVRHVLQLLLGNDVVLASCSTSVPTWSCETRCGCRVQSRVEQVHHKMRAIWMLSTPPVLYRRTPGLVSPCLHRLNRGVEVGSGRVDGILCERLDALLVRDLESLEVHGETILHIPAHLVSPSCRHCDRKHKLQGTLSAKVACSAIMKVWLVLETFLSRT